LTHSPKRRIGAAPNALSAHETMSGNEPARSEIPPARP
jgi:hypothetical protein